MKLSHNHALAAPTLKFLTLAVSALMVTAVQADTGGDAGSSGIRHVGDLEIYQSAQGASPRLMMMIDTSGSMGISSLVIPKNNQYGSPGDVDSPLCEKGYNNEVADVTYWRFNYHISLGMSKAHETTRNGIPQWKYDAPPKAESVTINGKTHNWHMRGCYNRNGTTKTSQITYDRLSRLKKAMIDLLASDKIKDDVVMGLGHYSSYTPYKVADTQNRLVDSHSGTILVEAAPLTPAHREKLIKALIDFKAVDAFTDEDGKSNTDRAITSLKQPEHYRVAGGTPTAHAYAEVGAAMLGQNTGSVFNYLAKDKTVDLVYDGYSVLIGRKEDYFTKENTEPLYYLCNQLGSKLPTTKALGSSYNNVVQCINNWGHYDVTYDYNVSVYYGGGKVNNDDAKKAKSTQFGNLLGGWRRVPHEPLDTETVTAKVWNSPYGDNLVTYRTSPFAIKQKAIPKKGCPAGQDATTDGTQCKRYTQLRGHFVTGACAAETYKDGARYTYLRKDDGWNTICHYMNTYTMPTINDYVPDEDGYNMGGFDYSVAASKNGNNYKKVAADTQCSGNGIFFLTDGAPNSTRPAIAANIMNLSLGGANTTYGNFTSTPPTGGLTSPKLNTSLFEGETGGWEYIGEYAKRLKDPTKNPAGVSIKTAVAGFGSSFAGLTKKSDGSYDCNTQGATEDAKNACKWGQKGEGYGEGGFFYTQSSDDISNSIQNFINELNNTIPASPSGTVTIPKDPYRAIGELPYALMPSLESQLSNDTRLANIWPGNIKKYSLNDGTLMGRDRTSLFVNVAGDLNAKAKDFWQLENHALTDSSGVKTEANSSVFAGGIYEGLTTPRSNKYQKSRVIWVEDLESKDSTKTVLRDLYVEGAIGIPHGFDKLVDKTTYSRENQIKLLQFLGYSKAQVPGEGQQLLENLLTDPRLKTKEVKDLTLIHPNKEIKVLGATIHSKPVVVSYGAKLKDGRVQNNERDDYALFGSMDGVLHLVNAKDAASNNNGGLEKLAIIPRIMMQTQPDALVPNSRYSISNDRQAATPYFGIDGHWTVKNAYKYDYPNNEVKTTSVYAYGGMRLGGKGLLGFNLTDAGKPEVAFGNKSLIDDKTPGFERISHIFNQPSVGKMKVGNDIKEVLIFGGGYDMCYENQKFQIGMPKEVKKTDAKPEIDEKCTAKTEADGNAVYIVDAKTGSLLWTASSSSPRTNTTNAQTKQVSEMKHSIVGGITALDRNNDGTIDQLYFADLGGQLFRADFKDGEIKNDKNSGRVTRLLKDNQENTQFARRFYERPNVSFYRNNGKLLAMINVISGDRSSPLSKIRNTHENADRIYGIIDTDVTKPDKEYYKDDFTFKIKDLSATDSKMVDMTQSFDFRIKQEQEMKKGNVNAWYYPLTKFDGFDKVNYSKGVGRSEVVGHQLFTTVYNPDMSYSNAGSCSTKIVGGSERQMYCLPWGVCYHDDKKTRATENGTGGYERAGQGIQELNFGPRSQKQANQRLLIGTRSMSEILKTDNRTNFNKDTKKKANVVGEIGLQQQTGVQDNGGSGTMERNIYMERYILTPNRWFEQ
ncbi:pilus assembly protein tip-associated adhesin PilY1 [Moraxella macacae 0408225]|uniref:Pilus assembly protein tip-associated adhesin PilY1 n=1 Tax=Moraxella macacae 0408225 TaxID=1230338 RepID=L2FA62_9GAMM|nr:pilus assembly protein tip-associated adhesin PilY1 [Moraxella macacae]ELA09785.1 pilus assembly protein tip-associated adhesin PilY1 [Moraxella macacae 0408225]